MAIVLRSDQIATNPNIDWKYLSPFGPTHQEVANYLNAIMARGFTPPEAAFVGLDQFVTELKELGLWAKVPEIMPLYGGDYEGVRTKLKGDSPVMSSVNGDAIGNYEAVGGRYIGRNSISYTANNSPALGLGFNATQLGQKWGFTAYLDSTTVPADANNNRIVMGASLNAGSVRQFEARLSYSAGHASVAMQVGSSSNVAGGSSVASRTGVLRWKAEKTDSTSASYRTYDDGSFVHQGNLAYDEANSWAREVWLFAKNPFNPPDTTTWGYNGKMRFAAFDDGTMSDEDVAVFSGAVQSLMAAMGKTF